jgi:hypothetical protein
MIYTTRLQSVRERKEKEQTGSITQQQSPVHSFMYALRSAEARRQYPKRLKRLFDFLGLAGSFEELQDKAEMIEDYGDIGNVLYAINHVEAAFESFSKAMAIAKEVAYDGGWDTPSVKRFISQMQEKIERGKSER